MASDPAQRPVDLAALVKLGASDFRVWAIEFDPPPGPRGVQPNMKPTRWKCSISTQDHARPMISAVRGTAPEAESAAKALFVEMMGRRPGQHGETFSDDAPAKPRSTRHDSPGNTPEGNVRNAKAVAVLAEAKSKPKPAVEDDDDDVSGLI